MISLIYVVKVIPLPGKHLLCKYIDGKWNLFDARPLLAKSVFAPLEADELFNKVEVSNGAVSWDNERIDIAPEYMYENGSPISDESAEIIKCIYG